MHNYEIDSLCYFVKLSYQYWRTTGISEIFDDEVAHCYCFVCGVWCVVCYYEK